MTAGEFHIPTPEQMAGLSPAAREAAAAAFLGTLDLSGAVSRGLFMQRARWPMPTIDLVPLIRNKDAGTFTIPLARRPPGDIWVGQLHVTGSVLLGIDFDPEHGEQDFSNIAGRIGKVEQSGLAVVDGPYEMYTRPRLGPRGPELTTFLVAGVEQRGELPEGIELYEAPEVALGPVEGGFIIGHDKTIVRATELYGMHLSGERPLLPAYGAPL